MMMVEVSHQYQKMQKYTFIINFDAGDKVGYESITINKKYEVLRVFGKNLNRFYSIKNDQGVKVNFSSKRFKTKTEIRDELINSILMH